MNELKKEWQECIIRAKVSESSSMSFSCGVTKTNDDALPDGTSADTATVILSNNSFQRTTVLRALGSKFSAAAFYTIALTYFLNSSVIDL